MSVIFFPIVSVPRAVMSRWDMDHTVARSRTDGRREEQFVCGSDGLFFPEMMALRCRMKRCPTMRHTRTLTCTCSSTSLLSMSLFLSLTPSLTHRCKYIRSLGFHFSRLVGVMVIGCYAFGASGVNFLDGNRNLWHCRDQANASSISQCYCRMVSLRRVCVALRVRMMRSLVRARERYDVRERAKLSQPRAVRAR